MPDEDYDGHGDATCIVPGLALGDDCDDQDSRAFPGATEVCDGAHDEDCDFRTPGPLDSDGDGYPSSACCNVDRATGELVCGADCDDSEPAVRPGADETCNGRDDDCDGVADPGCPCTPEGAARACDPDGSCSEGLQRCQSGAWGGCDATCSADAGPGLDAGTTADAAVDAGTAMDSGPPLDSSIDLDSGGAVDGGGTMDVGVDAGCAPAVPPDEVCNHRDDDCDGQVDEGCEIVAVATTIATGVGLRANGTGVRWGTGRPVFALDGMRDAGLLASGAAHICFQRAGRTMSCTGDNQAGQLGIGRSGAGVFELMFVEVPLANVLSISAGESQTCAVLAPSDLWCWGANDYGQLGDGTRILRSSPVRITAPTPISAPALGTRHSCTVIGRDGDLWCWGDNSRGQLGQDPVSMPATLMPLRVPDVTGVYTVCAGDFHTCVSLRSGRVLCWGANDAGQLGVSPAGPGGPAPVEVPLPGTVSAVSCGTGATCALAFDRTVHCWGYNDFGQAGNGSFESPALPSAVLGLEGPARHVAVGIWFACAALDAGGVQCWGYNGDAQLGDGTFENRSTAVLVLDVP